MSLVKRASIVKGKLLKTVNLSLLTWLELASPFLSKLKLLKRNVLIALYFNIYIIAIEFSVYKVDLASNK
jgi:hypothetical protein